MAKSNHVVAQGNTVNVGGEPIGEGQPLPDLPQNEINRLLDLKVIVPEREYRGPAPKPVLDPQGNPQPEPFSRPRTSIWDLDPDALKGLSVHQLNVMVAERDKTVGAFDTAKEAIAYLSKDHKAAVRSLNVAKDAETRAAEARAAEARAAEARAAEARSSHTKDVTRVAPGF